MLHEITNYRDSVVIATEINTIKARTKREVLTASIEIGQRLCEAKALLEHGEWESWLHDSVDYSQSTAENLMRIAKEYGDDQINLLGTSKSQTFGNLSYSQAIALFALPAEEREDFVKENSVEDMTARQLQEAIKAREEADSAKTEAENKLQGTEILLGKIRNDKDQLEQALKKSDNDKSAEAEKAAAEIKALQEKLAEVEKPAAPSPEQVKKLRAEILDKVKADFSKKEQQLTLEKKSAEDKAKEIQESYEDQLKKLKLDNESIEAQRKAAEKQLSLSNPEAQKFAVYFDTFQQAYQQMMQSLKTIRDSGNAEIADKLRGALLKIISRMDEKTL